MGNETRQEARRVRRARGGGLAAVAEEKTLAKVRGGEQIDRAWIDAALKESGAVIED